MKRKITRALSPLRVVVLGYFLIILTGALLLCLPISSRAGTWTPFHDTLFTATSATCVTGLIVYDTYTHWTLFGQIVILMMIQVGGIGFMTLAISALSFTKRKIGLRGRFTMQEDVGANQIGGIVRMTRFILLGTAVFEGAGALLLAIRFCPQFGFWKGLYFAVFHAVSAFCNAGFDLMGGEAPFSSLTAYAGDPIVSLTICGLIVIGGLGFFVWYDILQNRQRIRRYKLHTKVVLLTTFLLILIPFLLMLVFERNTKELHENGVGEYMLSMLFQTITPRTAGFNSVDYGLLSDATIIVSIFLMLVGGSPSSTAGGLKTTTLATWFAGVFSVLRRRKTVELFHRRMGEDAMLQIVSVSAMYMLLFFIGGTLVCAFDPVSIKESFFEVASALGTVGLTLGITPSLSVPSLLVLIAMMFFGRVGGITLLLAFHGQHGATPSKYPVEKINIG